MQEIKKYLEQKKAKAAGSFVANSAAGALIIFMADEKRKKFQNEAKNELNKYNKIRELLEVLEGKTPEPKSKSIDVEQSIVSALDEVYKEKVTVESSRDTVDNHVYMLKSGKLHFVEYQLETALKVYKNSKTY